jgi:hypothetical protein
MAQRTLQDCEMETLASRKGAKRIAVENFLSGALSFGDSSIAFEYMQEDARSYKWNAATQKAIADGLGAMYYGKRIPCKGNAPVQGQSQWTLGKGANRACRVAVAKAKKACF